MLSDWVGACRERLRLGQGERKRGFLIGAGQERLRLGQEGGKRGFQIGAGQERKREAWQAGLIGAGRGKDNAWSKYLD